VLELILGWGFFVVVLTVGILIVRWSRTWVRRVAGVAVTMQLVVLVLIFAARVTRLKDWSGDEPAGFFAAWLYYLSLYASGFGVLGAAWELWTRRRARKSSAEELI
jgi:hypothetical protein